MIKDSIVNKSFRDECCYNVYNDTIVPYRENIIKFGSYALIFKFKMPISCYTNFRDALFHFYKMKHSSTELEVFHQLFAIKEHLSRGETDALNNSIALLSFIIEGLLKLDKIANKDRLRHFLHSMREIQLKKRMSGMMIFEKNQKLLKVDTELAFKMIDEFYSYVQENDLIEEMKQIINEKNKNNTLFYELDDGTDPI